MRKLCAEFMGTFVLVLFGCGSAILAGEYIGYAGIAFAFGLSVLVMAFAVGNISGGHFNPAVTVGLAVAKRFDCKLVLPYIVAQLVGAFVAATVLFYIVQGSDVLSVGGFAANTYSDYTFTAAFLTELVMTFVFLIVILGATSPAANAAFAPIAIGLSLTCIHLVSIPVTNTSVNPARSTSQALFSENPLALEQLWVFWAAPILGAVLAGLFCRKCCCCSGSCACGCHDGKACTCDESCACGCHDGKACACKAKKAPAKKPMLKKAKKK